MKNMKWLCFFLAVSFLLSAIPVHGAEQMVATENKKPLVEEINKALTRIQITEGDNQDQTEWIFQYDPTGKLISALEYDFEGSIINGFFERHNEIGQLTQHKEYINHGSYVGIHDYRYEYDLNSRLICMTYFNDLDTNKPWGKTEYEYNEAGLLISELSHYDDGSTSDIQYDYGEDGLLIKGTKTVTNYYGEHVFEYFYDKLGRLILLIQSTVNGHKIDPVVEERYTYNEKGQLVEEFILDARWQETHTYDELGRRIQTKHHNFYYNSISTTDYYYNDVNQISKSICTHEDILSNNDGTITTELTGITEDEYSYFGSLYIIQSSFHSQKPIYTQSDTMIYFSETKSGYRWGDVLTECKSLSHDEDGYLLGIVGMNLRDPKALAFFYEDISMPLPPNRTEGHLYAQLQYPLSENDGYVLYKNFFGVDMDTSDRQLIISNSGEGESACITYTVYSVGDTALAAPLEVFQVYINTGICETYESSGNRRRFRAEDYYVLPLGQINDDGEINYADALSALRASIDLENITGFQSAAADVNRDGTVNYMDALMILRYSIGLIDSFY